MLLLSWAFAFAPFSKFLAWPGRLLPTWMLWGPFLSLSPSPAGPALISFLAAFSVASVETARESLTSLSDAERVDRLAVQRFSARLQVWANCLLAELDSWRTIVSSFSVSSLPFVWRFLRP